MNIDTFIQYQSIEVDKKVNYDFKNIDF